MEKGSITAPIVCRLIFTLLAALSAVAPGMAQQGSIYLTYAPFALPTMTDRGGLITFSPIGAIDGKTIQLLSNDGKTLTFTLNAKTIYCQGNKEATGWAYLKKMAGQKTSITVMTNEGATDALVVWDQGPKLTRGSGSFPNIDFPALCRAGARVPKPAGAAANAPTTRPPAAPATATAATPRLSISVPGEVQAARLIRQIKPEYPPIAKAARIQGTVRLSAVIGTDGVVTELRVVSGSPMLVQPALEAVRQWRYMPTLSNGEPAEVLTTIDVNFALGQ
jgi:TonB family protein